MTEDHQKIAVLALHKLRLEVERGSALPKAEYDMAFKALPEMKASVDWQGAY